MENEPLEPRSRSPKFNRRMNIRGESSETTHERTQGSGDNSSGTTIFIMSLIVAVIGDIAGLVFEIIPGVGGLIVSLMITPIGFAAIWGLNGISGHKISPRAKTAIFACLAIELIPIVNALPALTAAVIASRMSDSQKNILPSTDRL